jgi:hypothetical protein
MSSFTKRVLSKGKAAEAPKRGLAIFRSRERAAQGFRMVLAWCRQWCTAQFPSATIKRVIALLVCTIVCCALLQYTAPDGTSTITTSTSACSCHTGVNVNGTTVVLPDPDTAIMYLHRPQRPFHGNHWFHVGEYYLSRRKRVLDKLKIHALRGTFKHIKIIAQNHKLTGPMTKAAFSVLVLACLQELHEQYDGTTAIESVELYAPKQATLQFADATSEVHTVIQLDSRSAKYLQEGARARFQSRAGPIFGYYARSGDGDARFVDFRNDIESEGAKQRSGGSGVGFVGTGSSSDGAAGDGTSLRATESAGGMLRPLLAALGVSSAAQAVHNSGDVCECGIYVDAVGETPIPTAEWFDSDLEADSLRRTALATCAARDDSSSGGAYTSTSAEEKAVADTRPERTSTGERVLCLLIYQRDLNRRFTDLATLESQLHTRTDLIIHGQPTYSNYSTNSDGAVRWEVSVWRHSEQASPCALIKALNRADVFLTAHGFQSTGESHRMRSACVQLSLKTHLLQTTLRVCSLAAYCVALGVDVYCVRYEP